MSESVPATSTLKEIFSFARTGSPFDCLPTDPEFGAADEAIWHKQASTGPFQARVRGTVQEVENDVKWAPERAYSATAVE